MKKFSLGFWVWAVLFLGVFLLIIISTSMTGEQSGRQSLRVAEYVRSIAQYIVDMSRSALNFYVRKLGHVGIFCLLSICFTNVAKYAIRNKFLLFLTSVGVVSLIGVLDELRQHLVAGRVMSGGDMLFNATGAFIGALIVIIFLKISKFNLSEESKS